jgi:riboflavin synthase
MGGRLMFTGLVEEVGRITIHEVTGSAARLSVGCRLVLDDLPIGASIALDGCCVTVTEVDADGFSVDLMAETLRVTSLGGLTTGSRVNLERAMSTGARFGGHLVQGHVDAVGTVVAVDDIPGTRFLRVEVPADLERYLVVKGSITLSGVSLTIAALEGTTLTIGLIPHTLAETTLGDRVVGDRINLEVDVVAKYVERMMPPQVTR